VTSGQFAAEERDWNPSVKAGWFAMADAPPRTRPPALSAEQMAEMSVVNRSGHALGVHTSRFRRDEFGDSSRRDARFRVVRRDGFGVSSGISGVDSGIHRGVRAGRRDEIGNPSQLRQSAGPRPSGMPIRYVGLRQT